MFVLNFERVIKRYGAVHELQLQKMRKLLQKDWHSMV
jgi:hypothetical protein